MRHKLQGSRSNLAEAERYRKQQLLLERELSRVRVLLAHNSKVDNFRNASDKYAFLFVLSHSDKSTRELIIKNDTRLIGKKTSINYASIQIS